MFHEEGNVQLLKAKRLRNIRNVKATDFDNVKSLGPLARAASVGRWEPGPAWREGVRQGTVVRRSRELGKGVQGAGFRVGNTRMCLGRMVRI